MYNRTSNIYTIAHKNVYNHKAIYIYIITHNMYNHTRNIYNSTQYV